MKSKNNDNWDNEEPMTGRTKLALTILIFMVKIVSPYQFAHEFEKQLKEIEDQVKAIKS